MAQRIEVFKNDDGSYVDTDGNQVDMRPYVVVMGKSYRGSGRPDGIEIVSSMDTDRIEYLREAWGYFVLDHKPASYTESDAWDEFTTTTRGGWCYWK